MTKAGGGGTGLPLRPEAAVLLCCAAACVEHWAVGSPPVLRSSLCGTLGVESILFNLRGGWTRTEEMGAAESNEPDSQPRFV